MLNTTKLRTIAYGENEIQGVTFLNKTIKRSDYFLFHITIYTPKHPTSIVPIPDVKKTANTKEIRPPNRHNFMSGDAFALVKKNNLIICTSNSRDSTVKAYLNYLINKTGTQNTIELEQVANSDKINMIRREGVKSLKLGASLYKATVDHAERKTKKTNLFGSVAEEFLKAFAKSGMSNTDLKEYENLSVKLEISFDSRKKGGAIAEDSLAEAAKALVSEKDEDFSIVTRKGNKISANDIKVCKSYQFSEHGNSVDCSEVWDKLIEYYHELESGRVLAK